VKRVEPGQIWELTGRGEHGFGLYLVVRVELLGVRRCEGYTLASLLRLNDTAHGRSGTLTQDEAETMLLDEELPALDPSAPAHEHALWRRRA